jgi:uncharacterized membrane protein YfcA
MGLLLGTLSFWLDGFAGPTLDPGEEVSHAETYLFGHLRMSPHAVSTLGHYVLYFAAAMGLMRWWRVTARDRKESFSFLPLWAAAFWGLVLVFLWPQDAHPQFGVVPMVLAAIAVQWVSPWTAPPPAPPKRLKWKG